MTKIFNCKKTQAKQAISQKAYSKAKPMPYDFSKHYLKFVPSPAAKKSKAQKFFIII